MNTDTLLFGKGFHVRTKIKAATVEPGFNEPLYNEVLGITNHILQPGLLKGMKQNLDITDPPYTVPPESICTLARVNRKGRTRESPRGSRDETMRFTRRNLG